MRSSFAEASEDRGRGEEEWNCHSEQSEESIMEKTTMVLGSSTTSRSKVVDQGSTTTKVGPTPELEEEENR